MSGMPSPHRSRSTLIVILLTATLALTAGLAYEALQAARSHKAAAENVLRDYSAFAAWELTRLGREHLLTAMNHGITDVRNAHRRGDLSSAIHSARGCPSGCASHPPILSAFHATLPDARFSFAGMPVSDTVKSVLERAVKTGLADPGNFTCPTLEVVSANGSQLAVVWAPTLDRTNTPTQMIGYVTDVSLAADIFERLIRNDPLLPPSLVASTAAPNSALSVRVTTPRGERIFASSSEWSTYEASSSLPPAFGNLLLAVALKPGAAGELVIGGLPRERLPLIVGLLGLTAGLVVVALVQLRREAEISRIRADFVSGVSHELRTPLAQIRMFTETLLLGRVRSEAEGRRSLEIIAREAQRLAQLVENVLHFSRAERRPPELSREPARLAPIVRDVVESFTPLVAARQSQLSIVIDEQAAARVDTGAIRQILLNLLDNAVKYGPAGQTVRVGLTLEGDIARLIVEDEGPGVAEADAERIWEPFKRLAVAGTATGGAGIGLGIVRQLASLHGGRARVERGAVGARFIVELPEAWREADAAAVA